MLAHQRSRGTQSSRSATGSTMTMLSVLAAHPGRSMTVTTVATGGGYKEPTRTRACSIRLPMDFPFDVVFFASKDWDSHRQRPHWVAEELARRGAQVPVSYTHLRAHETDSY